MKEQLSAKIKSLTPFLVIGVLMILLCLKGGFFGFIGAESLSLFQINIFSGRFVVLFSLTWIGCLCLLLFFPRGLSVRSQWLLLLGLALACRLSLVPHEPSDDVNRYLWEGKVLSHGISPYHYAPDHPSLKNLSQSDPFFSRLNHPDMSAAYPPLILLFFSVLGQISYQAQSIKISMIVFDLAVICLLLVLLKRRSLDLRWVILYAFNPVILYSFAGQGHFDVVQIFFLLTALLLFDKRHWICMFVCLGLAFQSKYMAVLCVPFFVRKDNARYLWAFVLAAVVPYLPFVLHDHHHLFSSLWAFGGRMAFNGSCHALLRVVFQGIQPATFVCGCLLLVGMVFGYKYFHPELNEKFSDGPVSGCFFVFGLVLVLSPTIHFWYISWVIPFLVFRPTASWFLLCLTISGYFVANGHLHLTGKWHLPAWVMVVEWLPFYLLLFRDIWLGRKRSRVIWSPKDLQTMSVVIPAHNEQDNIEACVKAVSVHSSVKEVIVADAGSSDQTAVLSQANGARVVKGESSPGRGGQIQAGIKACSGDVVVICHADARIDAHDLDKILCVLRHQPMSVGGAIGAVFQADGWRLRLIEYLNDVRMICLGISFGDQVQFFRRRPVADHHVFPDMPLMEDVEFSLRLHRFGRQVFLFGSTRVSARRWQEKGFKHSLLVIRLVMLYLWKRLCGPVDARSFYQQYYY